MPNTQEKTGPNLSWLFQKDYYLHSAEGKRRFYTFHFADLDRQITAKWREVEQKKQAFGQTQSDQHKEELKKLKEELDALEAGKADFFKRKNEDITSKKWQQYSETANTFVCAAANNEPLTLTVGYPGFVTGTGIKRGIKDVEGEIKIGFAFDHTTGLPYLPASGLKGVLRSAFPQRYNEHLQDNHILFAAGRQRFLMRYFEEKGIDLVHKATTWLAANSVVWPDMTIEKAVDLLEQAIFHSEVLVNDEGLIKKQTLPISRRDIFFDAFLDGEPDMKLMATDFITPHINRERPELSPFTEPVPLEFLKIRPGMSFRFQWRLNDVILNPTEKSELFNFILTNFGIGAKTNVGYGHLT